MKNNDYIGITKLVLDLRYQLLELTDQLSGMSPVLAYYAELPYSPVHEDRVTIVPDEHHGTALESACEFYRTLEYVDDPAIQNEKNTLRAVGLLHCDERYKTQLIEATGKIAATKIALQKHIKGMNETDRVRLRRYDQSLKRLNFVQAYRPIPIITTPIDSVSFVWVAHTTTVKPHAPEAYLLYLKRLLAGSVKHLVQADTQHTLESKRVSNSVEEIENDIRTIERYMDLEFVYVRRLMPPHPRANVSVLEDGQEVKKQITASAPLITFSSDAYAEPALKKLDICPAERESKGRDDTVYKPILEHRNVYQLLDADRREKHLKKDFKKGVKT